MKEQESSEWCRQEITDHAICFPAEDEMDDRQAGVTVCTAHLRVHGRYR